MDDFEAARLRIYALQDGAVRAQGLAFTLRIGLFDGLQPPGLTFAEIQDRFGLSARVLPSLLSFLVSQELLARDAAGRFANTPPTEAFLVRESDRFVGGRGLLFQGFYEAIRHLPEALATGMPWTPAGQHDLFARFDEGEQRWFADGMFANAVHGARALLREVDFGAFRQLLDVGGNAGGYTVTLLAAHPGLRATIVDLEPVRKLAAKRLTEAGLSSRACFVAGSFFEDCLPRGHDAALLSSIVHDWADEDCARILANVFAALEPGGTIVVTEPMLTPDCTGPEHPSVSGLTMALLGGENRTPQRVAELLECAGFEAVTARPPGVQNTIVTARKPA